MVTGELPFGTNEAAGTNDRTSIPDPALYAPGLRSATTMLIEKMMQHEPRKRYETYPQLQVDLALLI